MSAQTSMIGRKIKGYEVTELIAEGGMGKVYRAEHPVIGKQVAIKILESNDIKTSTAITRFLIEAKTVNDIAHENLVDILDFNKTKEGYPYILMEYLEGKALSEIISKEAPLHPAYIGHIGLQICSGLAAVHQQKIVHRDLKGDNVFLITYASQENFVKILDFGIAKLLDPCPSRSIQTGVDTVLGTPLCMAPEQINCDPLDSRTDIYALGILLYQMATGRAPFLHENPIVLLAMHIDAPIPSPRKYYSQLSPALEQVILRCLQKNRNDRYDSMENVAKALGEACSIDWELYLGKKFMKQRHPTPYHRSEQEKASPTSIPIGTSQTSPTLSLQKPLEDVDRNQITQKDLLCPKQSTQEKTPESQTGKNKTQAG